MKYQSKPIYRAGERRDFFKADNSPYQAPAARQTTATKKHRDIGAETHTRVLSKSLFSTPQLDREIADLTNGMAFNLHVGLTNHAGTSPTQIQGMGFSLNRSGKQA